MAAMMIMPDEQRCVLNDSLALSRLELSTGHADLFRIFAVILHVSYSHGIYYLSLSNWSEAVSFKCMRLPMPLCMCLCMCWHAVSVYW